MKSYKIICLTGTRADYPRVKPVLKELVKVKKFDVNLYVTGQHVEKLFGYTINEIKRDKFKILRKYRIFNNDDTIVGMNSAFQKCLKFTSEYLKVDRPDLFLLTVDRIETLAAATAAFTLNIPIAHIQGGEVTGTMDETIRHSVTKMSHLHFAATQLSKKRIINMGENKMNVYNVGCPYVETINSTRYFSLEQINNILGANIKKKFALFTQHGVTSEEKKNIPNLKRTINALKKIKNLDVISIFSNADTGGRKINNILKKDTKFHVFKNLNEKIYLSLMKNCTFMIGNSSAGIREAGSFAIPVINVGTRQNYREKGLNVIDVPYNTAQITKAIKKCLYETKFLKKIKKVKNIYEGKNTSINIVKIIKKKIGNIDIQKHFIDG